MGQCMFSNADTIVTLIYYCNDLFYASLNTNLLRIVITNLFHRESKYKKYCV